MSKLINAYRTAPSPKTRERLQAYINKHLMAICMATPEEVQFLRANQFSI